MKVIKIPTCTKKVIMISTGIVKVIMIRIGIMGVIMITTGIMKAIMISAGIMRLSFLQPSGALTSPCIASSSIDAFLHGDRLDAFGFGTCYIDMGSVKHRLCNVSVNAFMH